MIKARFDALRDSIEAELVHAVESEAAAIAQAAQTDTAAPVVEAGDTPLQKRIVAAGAAARLIEFGARATPAQPFLFSALAARVQEFRAALARRVESLLRNSGTIS